MTLISLPGPCPHCGHDNTQPVVLPALSPPAAVDATGETVGLFLREYRKEIQELTAKADSAEMKGYDEAVNTIEEGFSALLAALSLPAEEGDGMDAAPAWIIGQVLKDIAQGLAPLKIVRDPEDHAYHVTQPQAPSQPTIKESLTVEDCPACHGTRKDFEGFDCRTCKQSLQVEAPSQQLTGEAELLEWCRENGETVEVGNGSRVMVPLLRLQKLFAGRRLVPVSAEPPQPKAIQNRLCGNAFSPSAGNPARCGNDVGMGAICDHLKDCHASAVEPFGWVVFADNGNVQLWTRNRGDLREDQLRRALAIYIEPPSTSPQPAPRAMTEEEWREWVKQNKAEGKVRLFDSPGYGGSWSEPVEVVLVEELEKLFAIERFHGAGVRCEQIQ